MLGVWQDTCNNINIPAYCLQQDFHPSINWAQCLAAIPIFYMASVWLCQLIIPLHTAHIITKLSSQLIFDQSCKANQGFCGSSYLSVCVRLCPPYQLYTLLLLHTRTTEQNLSRYYTIYRASHYQTIRFIYRTSRFCFKFGVALTPLYHCLTGSAQRVQIF